MTDVALIIKKASSLEKPIVDRAVEVAGQERDGQLQNKIQDLYNFLKQHPVKNEKEQRLLELLEEILRSVV